VNQEKGIEYFKDYKKVAFPWLQTQDDRVKLDRIKQLMEEVKKGGLAIRSMEGPKPLKSRLKTKIERPANDTTPVDPNKLYKKMGMTVPIR
jgi:hypothetical protein